MRAVSTKDWEETECGVRTDKGEGSHKKDEIKIEM